MSVLAQPNPPHSPAFFSPSERAVFTLGLELGALAQFRGVRLGLAESCTGGLASAWMTAVSGSSQWFEGGVVSYSNALKAALLAVPPELLAHYGAVSLPVAEAMASGVPVLREVAIASHARDRRGRVIRRFPNLRATYGIFMIGR